jgi:gluconate kinase
MTVVYLTAPKEVLAKRLAERRHHFMNAMLLGSQIDTLEPPRDAITIDATGTPEEIVEDIKAQLKAHHTENGP